MNFEQELSLYLRARFSLIILITPEEERALQVVKGLCEKMQRPCLSWDLGDGFRVVAGGEGGTPTARDPISALEQMDKANDSSLFVLKDFHDCWTNPQVKRKLRNLAQKFKQTRKSLLVTTCSSKIPPELKDEAVVLDYELPKTTDLEEVLSRLTKTSGVKVSLTPLGREKLVQAALGLTISQAQRVFAKAMVSTGSLDDRDIEVVTEEKKQIIRESEALEYFGVTETPDDVGGLGVLKDWLRLRERAFGHEAREYGLPSPKGVILVGIPGTGKSLTAKMIGGLWRIPLLRLDVGSLFGSLVGESEEQTRRALKLAETVAPCIVWIDEMEKAFSFGGFDGGTSKRVFGTILTWMQEKTSPCFVVATANDITSLPPELLRKGRFDEIFFLDLPTQQERHEILEVHLKKRRRLPQDFDVTRLASESQGFVGSEIEQAIIDAMYVGFNQKREFTTADISRALRTFVPLSVSQWEQVEAMRQWLQEGRAQSASFVENWQAQEQYVPLKLERGPEGWRIKGEEGQA
jgi:SpoVK/Ycf46/Vps4 family AAA+-type ATPase